MLPAVRTDEEWQAVVFDEKIVRPAAEDLAARLGLADRDRVVSEAGEMLAALHGLDPEPLHEMLGDADWADFLARQRATAAERQCRVKLPDR